MDAYDLFLALTVDTKTSDHVVQECNRLFGDGQKGGECVCVCVCVCAHRVLSSCAFSPQLQSITNPLPLSLKAAGLQTVKVQSGSDRGPVHGALCLDYTKLRPHKISRCVAVKFPPCCLSPRHG